MTFETSRLRPGEIVAAVGALLLFVFMFFFNWYGLSLPGGQQGFADALGIDTGALAINGWHGHSVLRWLMLLTIVAALALAFLTATQRTVALPVTMAVIVTALAALLTVLLAYRVVINEPGPNEFIDVKLGAWLGLLSSALITYGGYLSMRDEGTSLTDAREQARAAGQQAKSAFEGGAPSREQGGSTPPPSSPPPSAASVPPEAPPLASEPPAAAPPLPAEPPPPSPPPAAAPPEPPPAPEPPAPEPPAASPPEPPASTPPEPPASTPPEPPASATSDAPSSDPPSSSS